MSKYSAEHEAAREAVGSALLHYLQIHNKESVTGVNEIDDDDRSKPARLEGNEIVVAWVAALEWTNVGLEQDDAACREVVQNLNQTVSASGGLGQFIVNFYS